MPLGLSIYLTKKQAPHFFCSPPHAFGGFLKGEKWHAEPDFTPVSGKNSRENGPQMASSGISLAFSSAYLSISAENERLAPQPIYLSLEISSAIKVPALSPGKKRNPAKQENGAAPTNALGYTPYRISAPYLVETTQKGDFMAPTTAKLAQNSPQTAHFWST